MKINKQTVQDVILGALALAAICFIVLDLAKIHGLS